MNYCPCCSAQLLPHIRHNHIYWFCSRCRQEMPVIDGVKVKDHQELPLINPLNPLLSQRILVTVE
ncbi:MAG TPA: hypothetical protein DDZ80_31115 [Cyanobacteria bacterium UBA8803]|nr:hypothetical protein [Cyanobacteria bacterium UBA9273]HBL62671.1 hypothetical protein [Cyanobacteria bacterium UBA8803]